MGSDLAVGDQGLVISYLYFGLGFVAKRSRAAAAAAALNLIVDSLGASARREWPPLAGWHRLYPLRDLMSRSGQTDARLAATCSCAPRGPFVPLWSSGARPFPALLEPSALSQPPLLL